MKAAAFFAPGPPEVLQIVDLPEPVAGPGEVRVRVRVAGVQPVDLSVRAGRPVPGMALEFPVVPGNEFAGVVDQVGADVTGFEVGEEVLGFRILGGYAQLVVVPAAQLVHRPAGLDWDVAGGLSGAGQTAHTAVELLAVGPGDTFLIHAGAGAVGTVATQLARRAGATVIGTASATHHDYLRSLGAIPVAYGPGLVDRVRAVAPGGVDASLDAAGADALRAAVELVPDPSRIGTIVAFDLVEKLGVRWLGSRRSAARLAELAALAADGRLRIGIRHAYRLDQVVDAHTNLSTGHGRGKIVLHLP